MPTAEDRGRPGGRSSAGRSRSPGKDTCTARLRLGADQEVGNDSAASVLPSAIAVQLLFGSRARDSARPESDWDFASLGDEGLDMLAVRADLVEGLSSDRIDLADLLRAGGLLRYRAARDGRLLYEREPGCFDRFWLEAVGFWCDAQPVLAASYEEVLARLPR